MPDERNGYSKTPGSPNPTGMANCVDCGRPEYPEAMYCRRCEGANRDATKANAAKREREAICAWLLTLLDDWRNEGMCRSGTIASIEIGIRNEAHRSGEAKCPRCNGAGVCEEDAGHCTECTPRRESPSVEPVRLAASDISVVAILAEDYDRLRKQADAAKQLWARSLSEIVTLDRAASQNWTHERRAVWDAVERELHDLFATPHKSNSQEGSNG